jgi:anti-anti-sigma factor
MPSRSVVTSVQRHDGTVRVAASGDLDLFTVGELRAVLADIGPPVEQVVLDLCDVELFGSVGLHLVSALRERGAAEGFAVTLVAAPGAVRDTITAADLTEQLPVERP